MKSLLQPRMPVNFDAHETENMILKTAQSGGGADKQGVSTANEKTLSH